MKTYRLSLKSLTQILVLILFQQMIWPSCLGTPSFSDATAFNQDGKVTVRHFQGFDYVNTNAPKGGKLRLAAFGNFNNMNPFILNGITASGIEQTYETLGMYSFDDVNTIYAVVAKTFSYNKEQNTMIIELQESAAFQNNTPVVAEDIVASFNALYTHGHPIYKQLFQDIESAKATATHKITFKIKPNSKRDDVIFAIARLPVLSKTDLDNRDFSKTTLKPLLGTGPYQLHNYRVGNQITYKRNSKYWGEHLAVSRGRYNFDQIVYKYYKDQNIALTAFKAHRYDWRSENIAKFWATQYKGKAFDDGLVRTELIPDKSANGMQAFVMNLRRPLFQDINVRKALNLAFDFQWLNKNLFYDTYTRSRSFYANSPYAATSEMSIEEKRILEPYRDHLPESIWEHSEHKENEEIKNNLLKAQALLDKTDWVVIGHQRVNKLTKQPLVFTLLINSPAMKRVALPYKKVLKQLGITMHIQLVSPSNWISRVRQFDFDMITYNWPAPMFPGSEQYLFWHSDHAEYVGSRNIMGIKHPAIDKISKSIPETDNHKKRIDQMRALDRILMANHYVIPHWHIDYDRVAYWTCISPPKKHPQYGIDIASWYQSYPCEPQVKKIA